MRGNDLSNRHAPVIAIRVEGNIVLDVPSDAGIVEKLFNSKLLRRKLNLPLIKHLNAVWRNSDYMINLYAITPDLVQEKLEKRLKVVSYSNLFCVWNYLELREHLQSQFTTYYFDSDLQALSIVGGSARNISEFTKILR